MAATDVVVASLWTAVLAVFVFLWLELLVEDDVVATAPRDIDVVVDTAPASMAVPVDLVGEFADTGRAAS